VYSAALPLSSWYMVAFLCTFYAATVVISNRYVCVCVRVCVFVRVCGYVDVCIGENEFVCIHEIASLCAYARMHVCVCVRERECFGVCVCVYICAGMFTTITAIAIIANLTINTRITTHTVQGILMIHSVLRTLPRKSYLPSESIVQLHNAVMILISTVVHNAIQRYNISREKARWHVFKYLWNTLTRHFRCVPGSLEKHCKFLPQQHITPFVESHVSRQHHTRHTRS
jgi:hypothetical protein